MQSCVLIPAGGSGKRFGSQIPKQFLKINEKEIIVYALEVFQYSDEINSIVIASHQEWIDYLFNLKDKYLLSKVKEIIPGGVERQDSVRNALETETARQSDIILVHDAVRPFVSSSLIKQLLKAAIESDAAVPAVVPKNTIKSSEANYTLNTLDRNTLREIHTPQVFKRKILENAFINAYQINYFGTDSSSLLELMGIKSKIVESYYENIKITTPFDIELAKLILENFTFS